MKYPGYQNKRLLRQAAFRLLPRELIDRPKMGFCAPVEAWLAGTFGGANAGWFALVAGTGADIQPGLVPVIYEPASQFWGSRRLLVVIVDVGAVVCPLDRQLMTDLAFLRGRRVALLTNIPRPYRSPLYARLNQRILEAGGLFRVFYYPTCAAIPAVAAAIAWMGISPVSSLMALNFPLVLTVC